MSSVAASAVSKAATAAVTSTASSTPREASALLRASRIVAVFSGLFYGSFIRGPQVEKLQKEDLKKWNEKYDRLYGKKAHGESGAGAAAAHDEHKPAEAAHH